MSVSELERMSRRYFSEIIQMVGPERDIPAPDVNTNPQVMAWFMDTYSMTVGHTALGVVTGPAGLPTGRARADGFLRACRKAGVDLPKRRIRRAAYTVEAGRAAARALLGTGDDVTAVFCGNDLIALGALEAADELGLSVPSDLSVVGFDDVFFAALARPALTTIRQPISRLGKEAAELAIDLLEGRAAEAERRILPVELVIRGSTASPRAGARALAAAAT
jgi:DNA-binding LacI/PurR family transcriptional regulator